jgi:hypothetical protein
MAALRSIVNPGNVESALARLREELDQGRRAVVLLTFDHNNDITLSALGEISCSELCLAGALIQRRAIELSYEGQEEEDGDDADD